jgi:RND family efflux transporter MFP subunit
MNKLFWLFMITLIPLLAAPKEVLVALKPIQKGEIAPLQTFVGTLYFERTGELTAQEAGRITKRLITQGDYVKKGDILYKLDTTLLLTKLNEQKANVHALQAQHQRQDLLFNRTQTLYDQNGVSQTEYEKQLYILKELAAKLQARQARQKQLEVQHQYHTIKAPYSGIITAYHKEVGEWVDSGKALLVLADPTSVEVRLRVPSRMFSHLKQGQSVIVSVQHNRVDATIKRIVPQADQTTRTIPLTISLQPKPSWTAGMQVNVQLPSLTAKDALLVPRDAVIKRMGQEVVFINNQGKAMMIPVRVIGFSGSLSAVEGQGLKEGMHVVIKGNERIFPNMPIKVLP